MHLVYDFARPVSSVCRSVATQQTCLEWVPFSPAHATNAHWPRQMQCEARRPRVRCCTSIGAPQVAHETRLSRSAVWPTRHEEQLHTFHAQLADSHSEGTIL
jgi:hypothetical protein